MSDSPEVHGQIGVLAYDEAGDLLQCHVCGHWFENLGQHARLAHGVSSADYKREFGLNRSTPLRNARLQRISRRAAIKAGFPERGGIHNIPADKLWRGQYPPEQRKKRAEERIRAAEVKKHPDQYTLLLKAQCLALAEMVTLRCHYCGRPFVVSRARAKVAKWCSSACCNRAYRERKAQQEGTDD